MELKQNWHKFQSFLGFVPARKRGLLLLAQERRLVAGAAGRVPAADKSAEYHEEEQVYDHAESLWEALAAKYNADGATIVERADLLRMLTEVATKRSGSGLPESYYSQLRALRGKLGVDSGEKSAGVAHFGDKPVADFWPGQHFILQIFQSLFAELLPERKILLLGVWGNDGLEAMALEFQGEQLRTFTEPNFVNLDYHGQDLFHPATMDRFVSWCEAHYMLPTYALFFTAKLWAECDVLQKQKGSGAAWRHFVEQKRQREHDPEVRLSPEPWPLKAALQWRQLRS